MRKIFISYRRVEGEYAAGALGRELRSYFGEAQVFRDKEDIGGGQSWKKQVLLEIERDCAVLVLIGKDWANIKDPQGNRRLDNPDDPIRLEIADGFKDGAFIIPVLLENSQMPDESALPLDIRSMAGLNALKLRDGDWAYDLKNILKTLEKVGFVPVAAAPLTAPAALAQPVPPIEKKSSFSAKAIVGAVIALIAVLGLAADDLNHDDYVGGAALAIVSLILGILAWRDTSHEKNTWRIVGVVVAAFSGIALLAALGGLGEAPQGPQAAIQPGRPADGQ